MHYCWHYGILGMNAEKIKDWLEKEYDISCEVVYDVSHTKISMIGFDIEETHNNFNEVINRLPQPGGQVGTNGFVTLIHFPVYSEEEYSTAKWLEVRSAFSKVIPENRRELLKPQCIIGDYDNKVLKGMHEVESGPYVIKSPIKWGRNFFASADFNEYRLFCNKHAREILQKSRLEGMIYSTVIKKSTGEPIEDIYQLSSTYTVPSGAIIGLNYMKECTCDQCGMKMLIPLDDRCRYGLQEGNIPENIDFCQTQYMFLFPGGGGFGYRKFLISQRMYRVIKENMMDRSLYFEPIEMINS